MRRAACLSAALAACVAVLFLDSLPSDAYVASDGGVLDLLATLCAGLLLAAAAASLRRGHRFAVSSALSLAATALACATTAWTAMELSHGGEWSWRWAPAWLALAALRAADARTSRRGPTSGRRLALQAVALLAVSSGWAELVRRAEVDRQLARQRLRDSTLPHKRFDPGACFCVPDS